MTTIIVPAALAAAYGHTKPGCSNGLNGRPPARALTDAICDLIQTGYHSKADRLLFWALGSPEWFTLKD